MKAHEFHQCLHGTRRLTTLIQFVSQLHARSAPDQASCPCMSTSVTAWALGRAQTHTREAAPANSRSTTTMLSDTLLFSDVHHLHSLMLADLRLFLPISASVKYARRHADCAYRIVCCWQHYQGHAPETVSLTLAGTQIAHADLWTWSLHWPRCAATLSTVVTCGRGLNCLQRFNCSKMLLNLLRWCCHPELASLQGNRLQ